MIAWSWTCRSPSREKQSNYDCSDEFEALTASQWLADAARSRVILVGVSSSAGRDDTESAVAAGAAELLAASGWASARMDVRARCRRVLGHAYTSPDTFSRSMFPPATSAATRSPRENRTLPARSAPVAAAPDAST